MLITPKSRKAWAPTRRKFLAGAAALVVAKPYIAHAWRRRGMGLGFPIPPTPAPAIAAGYTRLSYFVNFSDLSLIDVNFTNNDGYKLYPGHVFPFGSINPNVNYSAANYAAVNGVLRMTNTDSTVWNLFSASAGASVNTYVGQLFTGGAYFSCSMAYDPTQALTSMRSVSWPAFWSYGFQASINTTTVKYAEPDFFEAYPGGTDGTVLQLMGCHDWNVSPSQTRETPPNVTLPGTFNLNTFHTYDCLWTTMADGGGTGTFQRYFDSTHISANDVAYNATTDSTPATSGSDPPSPNGVFSDVEDAPGLVLILSCGLGFYNYVRYVAVWQKPL